MDIITVALFILVVVGSIVPSCMVYGYYMIDPISPDEDMNSNIDKYHVRDHTEEVVYMKVNNVGKEIMMMSKVVEERSHRWVVAHEPKCLCLACIEALADIAIARGAL